MSAPAQTPAVDAFRKMIVDFRQATGANPTSVTVDHDLANALHAELSPLLNGPCTQQAWLNAIRRGSLEIMGVKVAGDWYGYTGTAKIYSAGPDGEKRFLCEGSIQFNLN